MIIGPIIESGLTITYDDQWTFRPDGDNVVRGLTGVKASDFISLRKGAVNVISIVELKSSAPHITNEEDMPQFLQELFEKMLNSLLLLVSDIQSRRQLATPSKAFRNTATLRESFHFILLISKFEPEWCPQLEHLINQRMRHVLESWGMAQVSVVNLALAHQAGWFTTRTLNITAQ